LGGDEKIARGDRGPVERLAVFSQGRRSLAIAHVFHRDAHPLGQERHDLEDRPQIDVDRIARRNSAWRAALGVGLQLGLDLVAAETGLEVKDLRDLLHLG